jgi:hypothetical protein
MVYKLSKMYTPLASYLFVDATIAQTYILDLVLCDNCNRNHDKFIDICNDFAPLELLKLIDTQCIPY